MTFSIAKGRSRRLTWNESDKTFGNPYMCGPMSLPAPQRRRNPLVRTSVTVSLAMTPFGAARFPS
jgi:hypothetical protein